MGNLVAFGFYCVVLLVACVIAWVCETIELIKKRRQWSKERFLANHIHYGMDSEGQIVKIK